MGIHSTDYVKLKRDAMAKCLTFCRDQGFFDGSSRTSILCIGDSPAEHEALRSFLKSRESIPVFKDSVGKPLCKTVKFKDNPNLWELGEELRTLNEHLSELSWHA